MEYTLNFSSLCSWVVSSLIKRNPRHVMHWRQAVAESIGFDFFGLKLVKEKNGKSQILLWQRGFKGKMGFLEWVSWRGKRHFAAHRSVTDTCTPVGQPHYPHCRCEYGLVMKYQRKMDIPMKVTERWRGLTLSIDMFTLDLVLINPCPIETYAQIWEVNWWTLPNPRCFVVYKPTIPFPTL